MGSGGLGKIVKKVTKALKPPTSKKDLTKIYKNTKEINLGRGIVRELTGKDEFEQSLYGKREAAEDAQEEATAYEAQQAADALSAKNAAADASNQQTIIAKRRRKASSVLSKAGSGLTESANTVLGSAATQGKKSLGA